jgi:chromate transporter
MTIAPRATNDESTPGELEACSLRQLLGYFLRLGTVGFGGPIALAGDMQRDLVEDRRWIAKQDYLEGLALAQLSPGPLAAQLAMYLGWVRGGRLGAALVGVAFVLPSLAMVMVVAAAYVHLGNLGWTRSVFYGVGAAVIAIIAKSTVKLAQMTLAHDRMRWALFAVTAVVTAISEAELVSVFIACGFLSMIVKAPPRFSTGRVFYVVPLFLAGLGTPASWSTLAEVGWFFTKAGTFVFGSGLAIVPFLHQGVVQEHGWLDEEQFRDAVAIAMITPGPVVITAAFMGFLAAGAAGAIVATAGTFVPSFLVVALAARAVRRAAQIASLQAFIAGLTASATGAIAGAAFILGRRAIVDVPTLLIALGASAVLGRKKRIPEPLVILAAGLAGFWLKRRVS